MGVEDRLLDESAEHVNEPSKSLGEDLPTWMKYMASGIHPLDLDSTYLRSAGLKPKIRAKARGNASTEG